MKGRVRKKTDADIDETRMRIFLCCYQTVQPLTCYEISKKLVLSRQNVAYHLPALVSEGLLLHNTDDDGKDRYIANNVFYDEELWEEWTFFIEEFISMLIDRVVFNEEITSPEEAIMNVLSCFPILMHYEVQDGQKAVNTPGRHSS
jgi:DNA-binding transcriptional ArsR family regulator